MSVPVLSASLSSHLGGIDSDKDKGRRSRSGDVTVPRDLASSTPGHWSVTSSGEVPREVTPYDNAFTRWRSAGLLSKIDSVSDFWRKLSASSSRGVTTRSRSASLWSRDADVIGGDRCSALMRGGEAWRRCWWVEWVSVSSLSVKWEMLCSSSVMLVCWLVSRHRRWHDSDAAVGAGQTATHDTAYQFTFRKRKGNCLHVAWKKEQEQKTRSTRWVPMWNQFLI